jgi:hypothetical protein
MPGFTSGSISNEEGSYKIQQLPWWTLYRYSSIFSLSGEYSGGFTLNLSDVLTVDSFARISYFS